MPEILLNWLVELTKLVEFWDRKIMQLRCFYAHAGIRLLTTQMKVQGKARIDIQRFLS